MKIDNLNIQAEKSEIFSKKKKKISLLFYTNDLNTTEQFT